MSWLKIRVLRVFQAIRYLRLCRWRECLQDDQAEHFLVSSPYTKYASEFGRWVFNRT